MILYVGLDWCLDTAKKRVISQVWFVYTESYQVASHLCFCFKHDKNNQTGFILLQDIWADLEWLSRLALAVRIFAKCEFILKNAKKKTTTTIEVFRNFRDAIFCRKYSLQFLYLRKKIRKCERKFACFRNFCERNLRPSASLDYSHISCDSQAMLMCINCPTKQQWITAFVFGVIRKFVALIQWQGVSDVD